MLLNGSLGQLIKVPSNAVPANLLPPPGIGLEYQVPQPTRGTQVPEPVQQRLKEAQQKQTGPELFPAAQPSLMPYLGSNDELGNTAIRPDPLIPSMPWDVLMQRVKYELSQYGLRYSLKQTVTVMTMTDVKQGNDYLAFYTLDLPSKLALYSTAGGSSAGWLSSKIEYKTGLDNAGDSQSPNPDISQAFRFVVVQNVFPGNSTPARPFAASSRLRNCLCPFSQVICSFLNTPLP